MCKNPGDSNYFQVLREEGDGEEKRSVEKKERSGEGWREKEEKGGRGLHILLLRKCESVLISHRCGAANSDARPTLKRQQTEKDTRKGGQHEYRMGMNHCMVRLSLNTVYNLFSESFFFFNLLLIRLIKRVKSWRRTEIKCSISPVLQVNRFSVYENVKKFPRAVRAHICAKTQARCERGVFALETNLQVTSSQDTKPHILLLIKKAFFSIAFPDRMIDT